MVLYLLSLVQKLKEKNIKGEKDTVHIKRNQKRELKTFIETLKISSLPQSLSLVISGGGLSAGDGGGGGGGEASSSSGAGASANMDRRMQLAEWLVLDLLNPDLRENALLKLSKVLSSSSEYGKILGREHYPQMGPYPAQIPISRAPMQVPDNGWETKILGREHYRQMGPYATRIRISRAPMRVPDNGWETKILGREHYPQMGPYTARIRISRAPMRVPDNGWETKILGREHYPQMGPYTARIRISRAPMRVPDNGWETKILGREHYPQMGPYTARIRISRAPMRVPDNGWETKKKGRQTRKLKHDKEGFTPSANPDLNESGSPILQPVEQPDSHRPFEAVLAATSSSLDPPDNITRENHSWSERVSVRPENELLHDH
ncbi:hypothetical protein BC332_34577 [Capsicum chinense]|nr:hypothetical protein BC332_34577 [Capsicum chinense]